MEVTSDANFWNDENAFDYVNGTFWYDTALASQAVISNGPDGTSASYTGPHDWLHTTLTLNGSSIDLTSSGDLPTFSQNPLEQVLVDNISYDGPADRIIAAYTDENGSSYRRGNFALGPGYRFLDNGLNLTQNASVWYSDDYPVTGYFSFETEGTKNGVDYYGFVWGGFDRFDIYVKAPEPSPLLLILCALPALMLRIKFRLLK